MKRDLAALVVAFVLVACGSCGTQARAAGAASMAGFSLLALSTQGSAPTPPASSVWLFTSAATLENEPYAIIPVPNVVLNGSAAALAIGPSVSSSAPTSAAVVLGPQALAALNSPRGGDSKFERMLASGDTTLSDVAYVDGDGSTSGRMIALGVKVGSGVFFPNEVRFFTSTNGGGEWKSLNTSTHTLYTNGSLTFVPGSATGYACSFLPPPRRVVNDRFVVKLSVRCIKMCDCVPLCVRV
jgi:hypothetical protein